MQESSRTSRNDDRLIRRYIDGQLTDAEFESFSQRLLTDEEFRRRYLQLTDLESAICESLTADPLPPMRPERQTNWRWLTAVIATISLSLIAAAVSGYMAYRWNRADDRLTTRNSDRTPVGQVSVPTESKTFLSAVNRDQPAAIVLQASDELHGKLRIGQRLGPGTLKFDQGSVLLEFLCGARVAVSGTVTLEIESKDRATLASGHVLTSVPFRARGFVLNAPRAAVVDLGTEFFMSVDAQGITDVAVTEGEIEWSLLGEDGTTMTSNRLTQASAVRLDGENGTSERLPFHEPSELQLMQILPEPPLKVSTEYVEHVKSLAPEIYWRFEDTTERIIRCEVGSATGRIENNSAENSVSVQNGNIRFRSDSPQSRYLLTQTPIEGLGKGSFSLEFWMRPDDIQHSTCVGLILDEENFGRNHLSVVEIATDTFLVHEPAAIRFLVRSPPEHDYALGLNAFSPSLCTPGQWQHVVAVWDTGDIRLYFNGRLVRHLQNEQPRCDGLFHVILGQLRIVPNTHRPYAGALDEFALYRHALTDDDIRRHYEMIAVNNPEFTEPVSLSETLP